MTFDSLIALGTKRMLQRDRVDAYCHEQAMSLGSWLVAYAHAVGEQFMTRRISWDEASSAFNSIWPAVVTDHELPAYFFDVYLAFEDAELLEPETARDTFSRERLAAMKLLSNNQLHKV